MEGFDVVKVLGSGSFGRAMLCKDRRSGEEVVVKEIKCEDAKALAEAKSEADLMAQHEHSNICRYVASFADEGSQKFYLVMEYADGGDLAGAINRRWSAGRYWPEADAMSIFVMCLVAIRHCHAKRIVHRDIKAANVFLTKAGVVKLGDFGVSKRLRGREGATVLAQTQVGTPYYLSPEIFEGQAYGFKSDVWSLGVLLYEVLALKVPFEARSMAALCRLVTGAKDPKPLPPAYSPQAAALVKQLLSRDPGRRPSADRVLRTSDYVRSHVQSVLSHTMGGHALNLSRDAVRRDDGLAAERRKREKRRAAKAAEKLKERPKWRGVVSDDDDAAAPPESADDGGDARPPAPAEPRPPRSRWRDGGERPQWRGVVDDEKPEWRGVADGGDDRDEEDWRPPLPIGGAVALPEALKDEYDRRQAEVRRNKEKIHGPPATPTRAPPRPASEGSRVVASPIRRLDGDDDARRRGAANRRRAEERRVLFADDYDYPAEPPERPKPAVDADAAARQFHENRARAREAKRRFRLEQERGDAPPDTPAAALLTADEVRARKAALERETRERREQALRQFHENNSKAREVARRVRADLERNEAPVRVGDDDFYDAQTDASPRKNAREILEDGRAEKDRKIRAHEELLRQERDRLREARQAAPAAANAVLQFDFGPPRKNVRRRRPRSLEPRAEAPPAVEPPVVEGGFVVVEAPPVEAPPAVARAAAPDAAPPRRRRRRRWDDASAEREPADENATPPDAQAGMFKALDGMWEQVAKAAAARNRGPPPPPLLARSRDDADVRSTPPKRAQEPGDIAALNAALNAALASPRNGDSD